MFKFKNPFRSKPVLRPSRHYKRMHTVIINGKEVLVTKFIEGKAKQLNMLFPHKSENDYYQIIYGAYMKTSKYRKWNGPVAANKAIKQLMLSARLQQFPKWWQKAIYVCYFHTKHWYKSLKKWFETLRKTGK